MLICAWPRRKFMVRSLLSFVIKRKKKKARKEKTEERITRDRVLQSYGDAVANDGVDSDRTVIYRSRMKASAKVKETRVHIMTVKGSEDRRGALVIQRNWLYYASECIGRERG